MPDEGEMEDEEMEYGEFDDEELYLRGALTGKRTLVSTHLLNVVGDISHTRPPSLQVRRTTRMMQQGRLRRRTKPLMGARPCLTAPWTRCRCWRACSSSRRTRIWAHSSPLRCWPAASGAQRRHWQPEARWEALPLHDPMLLGACACSSPMQARLWLCRAA